ncbi:cytochrome P450 [Collybia nuda]|uniref:Cytochrome P450 n=1 Tax=Collybia nuda TaxID=64659 RepID=A0A9P5YE86_9AGAR|nr:cytochrome P450 [Collybia nuda]
MISIYEFNLIDVALLSIVLYLAILVLRSSRPTNTSLRGPPRASLVWGQNNYLRSADDVGQVYESWAAKYGSVFKVPSVLGRSSRVVVCDPRAIANFYSKETFVYVGTPLAKKFIGSIFGKGLLWAEGESHRRQRKALAPAFSNAAIRRLCSVFFDSAYKVKAYWDDLIDNQADGCPTIDVQAWMNRVALDSIGIAGFSHDFGSLDGKPCAVVDAFESLSNDRPSTLATIMFLLSVFFPSLQNLPTERRKKLSELTRCLREIADVLLERNKQGSADNDEKSIIGLLIKAEGIDGELHLTEEEVLAQNVLLLAGYETTSISLTWALIELSRDPVQQEKLRKELQACGDQDPTWDQLMGTDFPYLDAVVHETLRLHPPLAETTRVASEDDILPLSTPLPTGETGAAIAKGTTISVPIICLNRAEAVWGPNAKVFYPERWLVLDEEGKESAKVQWGKPGLEHTPKEIQGHRHLLTFSDGPRTCLGKNFALTEFKATLSVLIRNYIFEFPDGPETKIRLLKGILPRPKVVGAKGAQVPLRVRKVE